tara:strand:+ start:22600 stop:23382 length:783 start_codon:yes stop_codon:yes gene_type:complete
MVLSKGLVISLGFSALSCTLLFLYFRNKMTTMERKVNVMFDIVQNYQPTQDYSPQSNQTYEPVHENQEHPQDNENNENTGAWNLNAQDDRIVISDDSDDEDDDSDEVSDSDSEDEDEEIPKLSLAKTDNISLTENDIKKISVKETPVIDDTIELEEVDSLDEIDDDDDDDDNDNDDDDDNNSETETNNKDIKKISVTKNDAEENIENDDDDNEVEEEDNDDVDYTQLKVSELKAIAEAKGLTNYKSLKKTPLIELIKSSE